MNPPGLSLLTFNIGNPSPERAQRQLAWLASRDEHVLVLTETKASAGCQLLAGAFTAAGYHVTYPEPGPGEYGTMIISRVAAAPDGFGDQIGYLPSRAAAVILPAPGGPLRVIGLYVPSRDASAEKTERKRKWLAACDAALASATAGMPAIVAGDLNILEPGHKPRYPFFAPFEYDFYQALTGTHGLTDAFRHLHPHDAEYSWVGRTGDGYRYDHAFCSRPLRDLITDCLYLHQPRQDKLSDHSALTMRLSLAPSQALPVSDPAAATEPATLSSTDCGTAAGLTRASTPDGPMNTTSPCQPEPGAVDVASAGLPRSGKLATRRAWRRRVREIELKYRVDDLEALLVALKSRGIELSEPVFQDDQAYAPAGWQFGDSKLGVSFLRLRTVQGRHYFTLKQPAGNAQDCLEYETQVTDRQAMHHAALHMGYRPTVRIAKTRRTATLEDCSLCIDEVEGVGGFLELERMAPDHADAQAIQADLAAFVSSLGIAAIRTDQTYDSLVHAAQE